MWGIAGDTWDQFSLLRRDFNISLEDVLWQKLEDRTLSCSLLNVTEVLTQCLLNGGWVLFELWISVEDSNSWEEREVQVCLFFPFFVFKDIFIII